jgi:LAS superfamily LD-carboxypeptidase LdcB
MNNNKLIAPTELLTGQTDDHIIWLSKRIGVHQQMLNAWKKLQQDAKESGFDLQIASGFRSFERQLTLWNNKFSGTVIVKNKDNEPIDLTQCNDIERINAILLFSALPGASRHHWGTDIDIYAPNLLKNNQKLQLEPWEYQQDGPFATLSIWLAKNSQKHGFYFPYNKDRGGVAIEPWHLSYAPLASHYQQKLTVAQLTQAINRSNILAKNCILENIVNIYKKFIININNP